MFKVSHLNSNFTLLKYSIFWLNQLHVNDKSNVIFLLNQLHVNHKSNVISWLNQLHVNDKSNVIFWLNQLHVNYKSNVYQFTIIMYHTTIVPFQLWHKLYYFHFCQIENKKENIEC